jgi:hypothetical protein
MAIKYTSSIIKPSKIYPKWDFGFENTLSGNPVPDVGFEFHLNKCTSTKSPFALLVDAVNSNSYDFSIIVLIISLISSLLISLNIVD